MLLIAEGQDFEAVFVEIRIKMGLYRYGIDLMPQPEELTKGKPYYLLSEIQIEASIRIGLIEYVEF